jgi:hypothetical protein
MKPRVGFVGIGNIGDPVCRHLRAPLDHRVRPGVPSPSLLRVLAEDRWRASDRRPLPVHEDG